MKDQIEKQKISAMKEGKKEELSITKLIINEINNKEKIDGREITEKELTALLKNMKKKREDSIEMYKKGNRQDLVNKELFEIEMIDKFLPKQLTVEETKTVVDRALSIIKPESMKDAGKILGPIKAEFGEVIDMKQVSNLLKEYINSPDRK